MIELVLLLMIVTLLLLSSIVQGLGLGLIKERKTIFWDRKVSKKIEVVILTCIGGNGASRSIRMSLIVL